MEWLILIAALFLAFSNGANDNFKGFATVWGAGVLGYRQALALATLATLAGSVAALFLAETLMQHFSGRGLVPDAVVDTPLFMLSVAGGAAMPFDDKPDIVILRHHWKTIFRGKVTWISVVP